MDMCVNKARCHPEPVRSIISQSGFSLIEMTKYTVFWANILDQKLLLAKELSALTANVLIRPQSFSKGHIGTSFLMSYSEWINTLNHSVLTSWRRCIRLLLTGRVPRVPLRQPLQRQSQIGAGRGSVNTGRLNVLPVDLFASCSIPVVQGNNLVSLNLVKDIRSYWRIKKGLLKQNQTPGCYRQRLWSRGDIPLRIPRRCINTSSKFKKS